MPGARSPCPPGEFPGIYWTLAPFRGRVRARLAALDLSQADLARLSGIDAGTLSRVLRSSPPSPGMAQRIARVLDVPVDSLLPGGTCTTWRAHGAFEARSLPPPLLVSSAYAVEIIGGWLRTPRDPG